MALVNSKILVPDIKNNNNSNNKNSNQILVKNENKRN